MKQIMHLFSKVDNKWANSKKDIFEVYFKKWYFCHVLKLNISRL